MTQRDPRTFPPVSELIPHRGASLMVDRIVDVEEGGVIRTERTFEKQEFPGHFPGYPVVPGVLLIEGLAQTLACLARLDGRTGDVFLTGLRKASFRVPVEPPAVVTYEVRVTQERLGITYASGVVRCEGKKVASAQISGAVVEGKAR